MVAKFIQGCPYWGEGWGSPPTNQKFGHSPSPRQILIPSHQKSIRPNKRIKTSFLAVVIAPVPFLFNFILFWHTGHANFDFNWCSVFTECCFSFEKGLNHQNHSSSGSHHPVKNSPTLRGECTPHPHPLPLFGKPCTLSHHCH